VCSLPGWNYRVTRKAPEATTQAHNKFGAPATPAYKSTSMMSIVKVAAALELAWATAYPSRESAVNELLRELPALMKGHEPQQGARRELKARSGAAAGAASCRWQAAAGNASAAHHAR
jgi:hypothetical protein